MSSWPSSRRAGGSPKAAIGLVSVMPQPWMMVAPNRSSNPSISDWGTAAPTGGDGPHGREVDRLVRCSSPFQMVGTPQASVGWYSLKTAASCSPMRNIWGMIMSVPAIQAP